MRILLRSVLAGLATSLAVGALRWIAPPGGIAGAVCDALALPGALTLSFWFPAGPHSGRGVPYWGMLVLALNFVLYWERCGSSCFSSGPPLFVDDLRRR